MKRCDKPALWVAVSNGYRVCRDCYKSVDPLAVFQYLPESGPGPFGRCDRPVDGMGAASWPKRKHLQ
jgi:hypothetical protein